MLPPGAVFAWFEGDLLPMHVKDIGILNLELYSTLPDLLTCIDESGHVYGISVLSVSTRFGDIVCERMTHLTRFLCVFPGQRRPKLV